MLARRRRGCGRISIGSSSSGSEEEEYESEGALERGEGLIVVGDGSSGMQWEVVAVRRTIGRNILAERGIVTMRRSIKGRTGPVFVSPSRGVILFVWS